MKVTTLLNGHLMTSDQGNQAGVRFVVHQSAESTTTR
jgi:hypothetical protein